MSKPALLVTGVCLLTIGACGSDAKKDPACTTDASANAVILASAPTCIKVGSSPTCAGLFTLSAAGEATAPVGAEFVAATAGGATYVDLECRRPPGQWDEYICKTTEVGGCCKRGNMNQPETITWQYNVGNQNDGYVCSTTATATFAVKVKLQIPGQCTLAEQTLTFNCQ